MRRRESAVLIMICGLRAGVRMRRRESAVLIMICGLRVWVGMSRYIRAIFIPVIYGLRIGIRVGRRVGAVFVIVIYRLRIGRRSWRCIRRCIHPDVSLRCVCHVPVVAERTEYGPAIHGFGQVINAKRGAVLSLDGCLRKLGFEAVEAVAAAGGGNKSPFQRAAVVGIRHEPCGFAGAAAFIGGVLCDYHAVIRKCGGTQGQNKHYCQQCCNCFFHRLP